MSPDEMRAIAVVNGDADRMAIWHVAAEPIVQTSRLCGAWVTDDPNVQRTDGPMKYIGQAQPQTAVRVHRSVGPQCAKFRTGIHCHRFHRESLEDTLIRSTIAAARWLAYLADTRSAIETARASKSHLSIDIPTPRPLSFVMREYRQSTDV
jgi:hypothetical protein